MRFDTVIIGGGLTGLVAGIRLQKAGQNTAIVSSGQNALHFFSGSFESFSEPTRELVDLFSEAGIHLHYKEGVRLMPMGTFRPSALSLEDISLFPKPQFGKKVLLVNIVGYHDFFSSFIAQGLEEAGMDVRIRFLNLTEMGIQAPGEMRSVQLARILDRNWEKVVQEVRLLLKDDDTVILPQVFGLQDASIPGRIRQSLPAQVVFAGTLPPSVPGIRTLHLLKHRYGVLGGTYLMGDEVVQAHLYEGVVHSVVTKNLGQHYLEAGTFILATGSFFSKGLSSTPEKVYEPIFGADVSFLPDRNGWYNPSFAEKQPYIGFGVCTDGSLRVLKDGTPLSNLYAAGSILGATHPELGTGAGMCLRSALKAADSILSGSVPSHSDNSPCHSEQSEESVESQA